jgi:hypothetical protein
MASDPVAALGIQEQSHHKRFRRASKDSEIA